MLAATSTLRQRLETLRALRGPGISGFAAEVRELILIVNSSRSGSSMLSEILRSSRDLLHLQAEFNPFLRLVGLAYPESGTGSDQLEGRHAEELTPEAAAILDHELSLDVGTRTEGYTDPDQVAKDAAWRTTIQWPDLSFDIETLLDLAQETASGINRSDFDAAAFQVELLHRLRGVGYDVNPWFYDLQQRHREGFGASIPETSPGVTLVEEPPFVLPRSWQRARPEDLASKPLVIKTPSNAYRLPFFQRLFRNARIRLLHLVRNPAASINGLIDGWISPNFHSHRVPVELDIAGYTDRRPGDRQWWKFDLAPGWENYAQSSLIEVCGFQWRVANEFILDDIRRFGDFLRIQVEGLHQGKRSRAAVIERVSDWLQIPFDGELRRVAEEGIPPVAATSPPRSGRWREREDDIRGELERRETCRLAEELGYGGTDEWI